MVIYTSLLFSYFYVCYLFLIKIMFVSFLYYQHAGGSHFP